MTDYPFGSFGPEHLKKIAPGIHAFNSQKYWECHEELEDVWLEDRNDPARNVYWAIIQVAASMVHFRENKIIGTEGMLNKAKNKFKRCREQQFILTDQVFDYLDWIELEDLVTSIPNKETKLEDYKVIFDFRFKNFPYKKGQE